MIVSYHRALAEPDPLLPGEFTGDDLRRHARLMKKYLNVLPLPEAVDRLFAGTLPERAACITFDDGYRNNFEVAVPILEEHGLTATFFIATGAVQAKTMFNDLVIEALRLADEQLDLEALGLGRWDCRTEEERRRAIDPLLAKIKYLPHEERQKVAEAIYRIVTDSPFPELMMTPAMVRSLADRGFDIGGHTATHPILANLESCRARHEIQESFDWLTDVTGRPPLTFAYPNGRHGIDFNADHVEMVQAVGFRCAVSTEWGVATSSCNRFMLPRLTPPETSEGAWVLRVTKAYARTWLASSS